MLDPIVSLSVAVAEAPGSYAVLLGSGASRDAGVPTGGEVFRLAVEDLYRLEGRSSKTPSRDELKAFLDELDGGEWTYSRILEALTPDAATRRDYLAKYFEGRQPAATHELLAGLAADGLVRVFVTTNFDRLLEHALQARGIEPVVVTDEVSLASATPREHADCYVLKPHGDYLQQTIRNTAAEIEQLPEAVDAELREVFNRYGVLVLGYAGSDPAIGRALRDRRSRYGLYWLTRGSLGADAAAIVEANGGRIIDRPDSAALLRDLRARLDVFRAHPSGQTPEGVHGEIVAALRRDDAVAVGELLRGERRALQEVLHEATVGRENEQLTDDNIRGLHAAVAPALERRLLGLLPLVDYAPEVLDAELSHLAALGERRPRANGLVFWIHSAEWAWWWLTHPLGAYAIRAWRPQAMRALLDARAVERDNARPLAAGKPGETAQQVGRVMCPPARGGNYWPRPEWQYLASSIAASEALAARYPELVSGDGEPKRALGEWNFVLALALGLRDEESIAYWSISPGAAQDLARRLYVDRRVRRELAEEVLAVDLEDLDARVRGGSQPFKRRLRARRRRRRADSRHRDRLTSWARLRPATCVHRSITRPAGALGWSPSASHCWPSQSKRGTSHRTLTGFIDPRATRIPLGHAARRPARPTRASKGPKPGPDSRRTAATNAREGSKVEVAAVAAFPVSIARVEVQELSCKALIGNVRFRLSPRLIDNRGALIRRLTAALKTTEFGWSDQGVDVFTTDRHEMFRLTGRDLIASCEHPESLEETATRIKQFVEEGIKALEVESAAFLGVRTFWLAPTDDFEGLRDLMLDAMGSGAASLADVAGKRSTDAGWVFEFHGQDPRVTVRTGPMRSEQAIQQIFRVDEPELYPPEFLFLDLDRVVSDHEIQADKLMDRLTRAIEHNLALAERFGQYFTTLGR